MASQKYEQMALTMNFQTPPKPMVPSISSGSVFEEEEGLRAVWPLLGSTDVEIEEGRDGLGGKGKSRLTVKPQ